MFKKLVIIAAMSGVLAACQTTGSTTQQAAQSSQQQSQAALAIFLAQQQADAQLRQINIGQDSLYALPQPALLRSDVQQLTPLTTDDGRSYLLLQLNEQGRQKLATISNRARGHYMLLTVQGQLVSITQITQPIQDGRLLMGTRSAEQSAAIIQALNTQSQ